jgi:hypothetical protein
MRDGWVNCAGCDEFAGDADSPCPSVAMRAGIIRVTASKSAHLTHGPVRMPLESANDRKARSGRLVLWATRPVVAGTSRLSLSASESCYRGIDSYCPAAL